MIDFALPESSEINQEYKDFYCGKESLKDTDFIGFTFGGKHSSDFGIVRITDGAGLSDSLAPAFQDKTVDVPGKDGSYFLNSFYTTKEFSLDIAYDSVTEKQLRALRKWLDGKEVQELVLDEWPYKTYSAKVKSAITLNYYCFEENGQRIYKGNGNITFVSFFPFARCSKKFLNEYSDNFRLEWNKSARLLENNDEAFYDTIKEDQNGDSYVNLYNPGDVEADFTLTFDLNQTISDFELILEENQNGVIAPLYKLVLSSLTPKGADKKIILNSRTQLLEGADENGEKTGNLYNDCILGGTFFQIPLVSEEEDYSCRLIFGKNSNVEIKYDYLYL